MNNSSSLQQQAVLLLQCSILSQADQLTIEPLSLNSLSNETALAPSRLSSSINELSLKFGQVVKVNG
jgi:hypothetical protein